MASRLDRLVLLLDTGSTPLVRSTAAQQLGEVQRQHPDELYALLARVLVHLRSKSWETRSAASQALAAIAQSVAEWDPRGIQTGIEMDTGTDSDTDRLSFDSFDMDAVIKNGAPLLASQGAEFDVDFTGLDARERLALQKKMVKQRLGMEAQIMDLDLINEGDLKMEPNAKGIMSPSVKEESVPKQLLEIGKSSDNDPSLSNLSARERNALKRKLKLEAKRNTGKGDKVWASDLSSSSSASKRQKTGNTPTSATAPSLPDTPTDPASSAQAHVVAHKPKEHAAIALGILGTSDEWPFEGLCEQLCIDLFHPRWEIRHGAALGLMEIIKHHGSGAGKIANAGSSNKPVTRAMNSERHAAWLEDVCLRILSVLALDRFADFVGDHVVVPVRETCARVLGVLLQRCGDVVSFRVLQDGLLKLIKGKPIAAASAISGPGMTLSAPTGRGLKQKLQKSTLQEQQPQQGNGGWEMRHAGLIGLKYWMAVKKDLVQHVLVPQPSLGINGETPAFIAILNGLKDRDDDVRSVSSSTLLPICDQLVTLLPPAKVYTLIVSSLWDCLEELDDLTAATASVMDLLSQLLMRTEIRELMKKEPVSSLSANVPRLYPFFRHAITSVRIAVLKTVSTLLDVAVQDSSNTTTAAPWITAPLLMLIFQNFVLEDRKEIISMTQVLWKRFVDYLKARNGSLVTFLKLLTPWFSLVMTPMGVAMDLSLFYNYLAAKQEKSGAGSEELQMGLNVSIQDRAMVAQDLHVVDEIDVLRGRLAGAVAMGQLVCGIVSEAVAAGDGVTLATIQELLCGYLRSGSASHRVLVHIIVEEWANAYESERGICEEVPLAQVLWNEIMAGLVSAAESGKGSVMYTELLPYLGRVRQECLALLNSFAEFGAQGCPPLPNLPFSEPFQQQPPNPFGQFFTVTVAERLLKEVVPQLLAMVQPGPSARPTAANPNPPDRHAFLADRQNRVQLAMEKFAAEVLKWETQTMSSAAGACVRMGKMPAKPSPIIRPLMGSVKSEASEQIQQRSASNVAKLFELNVAMGKSAGAMEKVINNLGVHLCNEAEFGSVFTVKDELSILSMVLKEDKNVSENSENKASVSQKRKKEQLSSEALVAVEEASGVVAEMNSKVKNDVTRRGARFAFDCICDRFGPTVFEKVPKLWDICSAGIMEFTVETPVAAPDQQQELDPAAAKCVADSVFAQTVVDSLFTLSTVVQSTHKDLHPRLCTLLRPVSRILRTPLSIVRYAASLCISAFAKTCTPQTMQAMVEHIIPLLGDSTSIVHRQGAAECISMVVSSLEESRLLPYIVFLIVPVLGRMSDPNEAVRFVSTSVFAHLVKLVPLEAGVSDPEGMDPELVRLKKEERKFMGQLIGSEKVEHFEVPKGIKAELRPYQKEGVSWLAFLNRYGLHGILCDDMGLGKTLQSICMLASDHHIRAEKFAATGSPEFAHTPSIVVCPPTLTGHWRQEILQYAGEVLKPMIYVGATSERKALLKQIPKHDVVITSYEILRNDMDSLTNMNYNYCILDEGHVIKNAKTKLTKAVKTVRCMNRLILSGTPVQNNVLELWSLFDFLMPGFLGTESQFQTKFGKPILASRDAKSSSREQERGALALEALHKQVLPFLMRRMKEDVLDDLPPKIIQDFYVDLGDIQKQLYEDFGKSSNAQASINEVKSAAGGTGGGRGKTGETHVFQALQYLRKLCNHPSLVLKPQHPQFSKIMDQLKAQNRSIDDVSLAPKISALKQILIDCGIGVAESDDSASSETVAVTAPHRVLVFCQMREMLDYIENGLFKSQMKSVSYLRMDGTTDTSLRHDMVQKFNADPSIDVFLLTTSVGGLGLNLTGADTVIFVEHDWNPMKDLQAMDRAHRIGQKRVVNVYRLITRGTLEEKIMGLQKFKLNIASSIINQDNAGIESMDTTQILDLFNIGGDGKANEAPDPNKKASAKEVMEGLGALWDESQYDSLADMGEFMKGLQ
ncbi:hypothetical protein CcCBS67573_g02282 [Chytriomyces confervae]|uniref:TATA-binding protein-associated factor mot1 n=1 Tax=Chytriomyces confervae TaxID=246404 RepID=A0A507FM08_9FUNG|nr:btaf1 RNA polymerase II, B-TFIID transcription factor-associated, 170kDa [Chytriomyces hyalinus]TPX76468.1 hypothetical protein CcCBS67573_g02282 [Chytriomyces confervae]